MAFVYALLEILWCRFFLGLLLWYWSATLFSFCGIQTPWDADHGEDGPDEEANQRRLTIVSVSSPATDEDGEAGRRGRGFSTMIWTFSSCTQSAWRQGVVAIVKVFTFLPMNESRSTWVSLQHQQRFVDLRTLLTRFCDAQSCCFWPDVSRS